MAAALANVFIAKNFAVGYHFLLAGVVAMIVFATCFSFLLNEERKPYSRRSFFVKPGKESVALGLVAFCSLICQGAMFDWSGIYFKKIVTHNLVFIGFGYTAFMVSMTSVRFVTDWLNNRMGFNKVIRLCGIFITASLILAIIFPFL
jgi:hypothetical protein